MSIPPHRAPLTCRLPAFLTPAPVPHLMSWGDDKPGDHTAFSGRKFRRCSIHLPSIHSLLRQVNRVSPYLRGCLHQFAGTSFDRRSVRHLHRIFTFRFLITYLSVFSSSSTLNHPHHKNIFLTKRNTTPKIAFISRTWHSICQMQAKRHCRGLGGVIVDPPCREVTTVR